MYISKVEGSEYPLLFVEEADSSTAMWVRKDGINDVGDCIKIKCDVRQTFKDGDVLVNCDGNPFLFNGEIDSIGATIGCHCGITYSNNLYIQRKRKELNALWAKVARDGKSVRFATKEEKKILVDKLIVDGSEKARKILSTYFKHEVFDETEKLKPFDKVLVRDYSVGEWYINLFHRTLVKSGRIVYQCCGGAIWNECLPYEGNEHLLNM